TPGGAGKLLVLVAAGGANPNSFGGVNLVETINKSYNESTGQYGKDAIGHAFAMLGLRAAGKSVPAKAATFLKSVQNSDGGWAFSGEIGSGKADTNSTAVAVQALIGAGESRDSGTI